MHESSFGWGASMHSSSEVKGPPISVKKCPFSPCAYSQTCLSPLACSWPQSGAEGLKGIGGVEEELQPECWGNKVQLLPGFRASQSQGGLLQRESQGFDSALSSAAGSQDNRRPKAQGLGLVRVKGSGRVGSCWRQWHWCWWGDNDAGGSGVGGNSGVNRKVDFLQALLTDLLDWSTWVKGANVACGAVLIYPVKDWASRKKSMWDHLLGFTSISIYARIQCLPRVFIPPELLYNTRYNVINQKKAAHTVNC